MFRVWMYTLGIPTEFPFKWNLTPTPTSTPTPNPKSTDKIFEKNSSFYVK